MNELRERIEQLGAGQVRAFLACTGGGAGLQKLLWDVPGTSRFLVGASFPYAAEETHAFLGFEPARYCDADAAIELALAAYRRAWQPRVECAYGIGLTAVVATDREHRGEQRVYVAAFSRAGCRLTSATLDKGVGSVQRAMHGELCDRIGLNALLEAVGVEPVPVDGATVVHRDVTERARELLLARPFFAANGARRAMPIPAVHFPGTFDPPHRGHRDVREHLLRLGKRMVFTIDVDPPHKEGVSTAEMLERAELLAGCDVLFTSGDALYIDKARRWRTDFAIGTDALARMLDPRWGVGVYELLAEFERLGTRFFVAERCVEGEWLGLDRVGVPDGYRHLFFDLGRCWAESSTALRAGR